MACGRGDLWAVGGLGREVTDAWRTASALIALLQPLVFPPSRAVGTTAGFFTDGHGPRPSGGPRQRPICWLSRSSWPWMQWVQTVSRTATLSPALAAIWAGSPPAFSHSDKAACRRS